MPKYRSADHHILDAIDWDPRLPAERINDHILISRSTSNSYLVTTSAGDVVINTGMSYQSQRHRVRYETLLGRTLNVKKILLTQSHADHMGGWADFVAPDTETIIQRNFPRIQRERALLSEYFRRRGGLLRGMMPNPEHMKAWKPEANAAAFEAATQFSDVHQFELGGRHFEIYATPSGETIDSLVIWLPKDKAVFTGNLLGALQGALPHYYTPRGDRDRSIAQSLRDIELLIGLEPALLITGHDAPILGRDIVQAYLTKLRDAVRYLHDETVKGMNAGKDLFTLMAEIALPPELQMAPGRGPVRWYVRSVWEEYTGWFRQDSTTELYAVPPRAIWSELAELAGGAEILVQRAKTHIAANRPEQALHFTEIALARDPANKPAREVEIAALEQLIDRTEGKPYDEISWLEFKIDQAKAALAS